MLLTDTKEEPAVKNQFATSRIQVDSEFRLLLLSILVGLVGGFGAIVFRLFIGWVNFILVKIPQKFDLGNNIFRILVAPTLGGLIVGTIIYFVAQEAKGHGVPEIIHSVNKERGRMRYRIPFVKIIASAITIGSGGSAGREGPIAQIGGGFGSLISQKMGLSDNDTKTLVISGVSAGIAATFNAPLGGALFGLEIIRRDQKSFSILPLIVSSVVGTTVGTIFLGQAPAFVFPTYLSYLTILQIPLFIFIGLILGLYSVLWVKGFYYLEDLLTKIPISTILLAGLGGLMVGIIEIWIPGVNGISYGPIDDAFALKFTIRTVIILTLAKFFATALSIGSGGSGGVFAPTLFQGAMLGSAFGLIVINLGFPSDVEIFALLGMAALFAGSSRAPLTAIIMTSEMVNDFQLIIPLMFTVTSAWLVSKLLMSDDIYILKLKRRGIEFSPSIDILEDIKISEIMIKDPVSVSSKDRIEFVLELMKDTGHTGYPVMEKGRLIGVITEHDVDKVLEDIHLEQWIVSDHCSNNIVFIFPHNSLSEAFILMADNRINRLPVVNENDHYQLLGWITRSDIMKIYREEKSLYRVSEVEQRTLARLEE